MKEEILSPKQEKITPKKTESPQKTPAKKSPAKKKTVKSSEKAKTSAKPMASFFKAKTESDSPAKSKPIEKEKMETDETNEDTPKPNTSSPAEEKPKVHPLFSNKKDLKLQSAEDTSNGALYDPGKAKYHPIKDCFWKHGEK